ncbi:hypothetical protein DPMN_009308 [Dreissena polymorpha]|uniref:DUF4806 domain-containing protein n=1 Tax=Dreissena polymorpha TaxID=45954 RepID=A0A9D4RY35_DREPO|nr:hypothetical protein DPMN_009308 [Dreissena polymorpha]
MCAGAVSHLSVLGGRNRADVCRRILKHCMSNEVANQYSWHGRKKKAVFGKLPLADAVQKAVMRSLKCTAEEVEHECREWFRTASDRDGGRKKRTAKKSDEPSQ